MELDPLNHFAMAELAFLNRNKGKFREADLKSLTAALRGEVSSYLELAMDYANSGLFNDASQVLEWYVSRVAAPSRANPLAYYYLGYFAHKRGDADRAMAFYRRAAGAPPDFCFPFQFEAEPILLQAIKANPQDGRACYYLGNLLFDSQPLRAIEFWEKAVQLEPQFAMAHRYLGFARAQAEKDISGAILSMERAVALNPDDARVYYELDVLYEAAGTGVAKRLEVLSRRSEVVTRRDDAVTRRISCCLPHRASTTRLCNYCFIASSNWEGGSESACVFVDACLQMGLIHLRDGRAEDALKSFERAGESRPMSRWANRSENPGRRRSVIFRISAGADGKSG